MNQNSNFNFGIGESNSGMNTYDSYYKHQPRNNNGLTMILITIILIIVFSVLWFSGFFTPRDRKAENDKLFNRVCNAARTYADNNNKNDKRITGKIVYLTVGQLSSANLLEATLINPLNNEKIPSTTYIKLEVLPSGEFQCYGFVKREEDRVKPVITLKGEATIYGRVGEKVIDPGATAIDDVDGDISERIQRSGNVNINTPGTYKINYVVSDISGNISKMVTRTYIIQ